MAPQTGTSGVISDFLVESVEAIYAAVQQLTKDTRHREMRCLEHRSDTRLPFHRSVRVMPMKGDEPVFDAGSSETFMASTRHITLDDVGFLHDQPIDSRCVLLTFELLGGAELSLVADLRWHRYLGDFWYLSGGKLIGVVTPPTANSLDSLETKQHFA